jgi:hypothetical protein
MQACRKLSILVSNLEFPPNFKFLHGQSLNWLLPAYLYGAISYSSEVVFAPEKRKWKGREHSYRMGTIKIIFVAIWYRVKSYQGSGPGVPSPKQAQIEAMIQPAHKETYRKKSGGSIRFENFLNNGHFLTYNDQSPKAPFPPKQLYNFPTPWGFIPVNPTSMDGWVLY